MRIVIDSNVLFSALISDSTTRKMILDYDCLFLFPEFIFDEMNKHKAVLFEKSCALAYPNSILWSNDHRLKAIREITVKNTKEVIQLSQG
ncbi:MAG TPA: PIN domain-containing protein [Candidatus Nanoarchaeia archaeon]|nr:PIN domain-containing protein [Candidatus Nanoarchaeia archaeon]